MTRRAELLSSGQAKRFASRLIPSNSVVAESVLELIYAKIWVEFRKDINRNTWNTLNYDNGLVNRLDSCLEASLIFFD